MATVEQLVELRGGGNQNVYAALLRAGLQEPEDFALTSGPVDFVLRRIPRALAILTATKRQSAALALKRAALAGEGIDVQVAEESEATLFPDRVVARLLDRS